MADRAAPLAGRTVLLTRPAGRSSALIQRLKGLGAEVEAHPTIALDTPSDPAPARRAVRRLPTFDWVLFTSANGVRFFVARLHEAGTRPSTIRSRIAAIGPATADALSSAGLTAELVATDSHSEGFAEELRERITPGQKVLIVGPEVARSVLVDAIGEYGAETEAVAFYRNIAAPGVDDVAEQVCRDRYDLVVFTSPSTIRRLLEAGWCSRSQLSRALGRADIVAIGQVTARAVEEAGLRAAAVARHPNDDGIVAALVGLSREKS
jgi:uroporphyrinogen-III synthase